MSKQTVSSPSRQSPSSSQQTEKTGSSRFSLFSSAVRTGKFLLGPILGLKDAATKQAIRWVDRSNQRTGKAITFVSNLPLVRRFAGVLRLDWLMGITDRVDLAKAEAEVKQLQQKYPNESSSQIAHRIMMQKAFAAGRIGFVSSIVPGIAIALLAVDLAATTALQAEMLYQIAAAYGLDLRDPARKGEVLGIFGLALGGRNAVRAGLGFLRNVPLAGAMIGAGTDATMLYSLGYAACRFYEAKLRSATEEPSPETLQSIQQESEQYLNIAIAQQGIVDQILVHMILASYPDKTWEAILPELQRLQLEPDSLSKIAAHLQSPEPLGALLQQLNCDFAVPLLAHCRRIAESNGEISPEEAEVIDAIAERCQGIELASQ